MGSIRVPCRIILEPEAKGKIEHTDLSLFGWVCKWRVGKTLRIEPPVTQSFSIYGENSSCVLSGSVFILFSACGANRTLSQVERKRRHSEQWPNSSQLYAFCSVSRSTLPWGEDLRSVHGLGAKTKHHLPPSTLRCLLCKQKALTTGDTVRNWMLGQIHLHHQQHRMCTPGGKS